MHPHRHRFSPTIRAPRAISPGCSLARSPRGLTLRDGRTFLVIPGGYDARMSSSPASRSRSRKRLVIPRGTVATLQITPPGKAPLTRDDLTTGIAGPITDLVAATCLWKDDGWQIGDYRFMVLSVHLAKGVELYVQLWSEPLEPVLWEVSSGRANPPADQAMAGEPSALVRRLGFRIAGQAKNFRREVAVANRRDAARTAAEVVAILYTRSAIAAGRPSTCGSPMRGGRR